MKKLLIVWVLILGAWAFSQGPDERIILSFTINGKPTQLALDTGANAPVLYRKAAERLGVRITNAPPALKASSGHLILPLTELVDLGAFKTQFGVYDQLPGSLAQEDGILPWQSIRNQALTINAEALDVGQPALMEPPPDFKGWTKLTIATNTPFLELEITAEGEPGRILIDTGYAYGVAISRKKWSKWRTAHPGAPSTLETGRFPSTGPFVAQEAWAGEISLGNLVLYQVPILDADVERVHEGSVQAIIGIVALKRLLVCVDAPHGVAYVLQKYGPPRSFRHNRLGAVFPDQVATVVKNSGDFGVLPYDLHTFALRL